MDYDFNKAWLYPAAWAAFKANLLSMIGITFGLLFLGYIGPVLNLGIATSFGQILLQIGAAFLIHQTIIAGKTKPWFTLAEKDSTTGAFTARSIGFLAIVLIIGMVVGFVIYFLYGNAIVYDEQVFANVFIFAILPIYGIVLALFGTILPATIAQGDKSLRAALTRGKSQFWYTLSRLIFGQALILVAVFIATFLTVMAFSLTIGKAATAEIFANLGNFGVLSLAIEFVVQLLFLFSTALAATTLCKAYLRYEQRPEPTPDAT